MENDTFIFLKDEFNDIYIECNEMEKLIINGSYNTAIIQSRKAMETIINTIYHFEKKIFVTDNSLNTKIRRLHKFAIIPNYISNDCHEIRKIGNTANHGKLDEVEDNASKVHQLLYNVSSFFYKEYTRSLNPSDVKPYSGIPSVKQGTEGQSEENGQTSENNDLEDYEFYTINGSYLHGELHRLKNSSMESVESFEKLSYFKTYLHVDREIQNELFSKIEESVNNDSNKLILLCGSVGDGKSHLLSYFNQNYPKYMNQFEIINDATESSDPDKTSIDRLAVKLSDFNDENINKNNKKIILSINLGVLNNFLNSNHAKMEYNVLSSILDELNIFDVNDFSNNFDKDPVSIISFSDNNIFEFDDDKKYKVYSEYMSQLFNKVTNPVSNNPFYQAFKKDINNSVNGPIPYNYRLFSLNEVQDLIINNLIKIIIKYKKIISTRELLNFIYEIIVPANIQEYSEEDSLLVFKNDLLPNLFFNTQDRCTILQYVNYEDPVYKRSDVIDQLLMDLNISDNVVDVLKEYMELDNIPYLKEVLDNVKIKDIKNKDHDDTIITIIRFLNFFGKEDVISLFTKESYIDYVNYLMSYNRADIGNLRHLKTEIKDAMFNWKGKMQDNYICTDILSKFKIAKQIDIGLMGIDEGIQNKNNNRFKTSIHLKFSVNNNTESLVDLNLDYSLYEVITKLNKGYKPNKSEQKDLLLFNEFIDKLLNLAKTEDYRVYSLQDNLKFRLSTEFGFYSFEKV